MASDIKDNVKEYYGKILKTNEGLLTNACVQEGTVPEQVKEALDLCHKEVKSKYYGCGLPFPKVLKGLNVLDFGSGAGRDCYILSKLVGKDGFVTGVDMTREQLDIARQYLGYHTEKFGYSKPNVDFKLGYIEDLKEVGLQDECCDLIISNCVINLCPDKKPVFEEAFRVLKEGGELYFSDMYVDRELPQSIKKHKELWGEGFGGALYWKSFIDLTKEVGFCGPYLVSSRNLSCENEELVKLLGDAKYVSATYRLFKTSNKEDEKSCSIKYKGTMIGSPESFRFDHKHVFDSNFQAVSCDVVNVLKSSRYCQHLEFKDSGKQCTIPCAPANSADPFELAKTNTEQPPCRKKPKVCC